MPQIHARMLPQAQDVDVTQIMRRICAGVAEIVGVPPQIVRASWEFVAPGNYVQGDEAAKVQPPDSHPPVLTITMLERPAAVIEAALELMAREISTGLRIEKGNAFITYVEARKGQVNYVVRPPKRDSR